MTTQPIAGHIGTSSPPNPRLGFAITATLSVLVAGFFAAHQAWSTGFFLPSFAPAQAGLLYGSILYAILVMNTEVLGLRKDHIQIVNLVGAVLWTVTATWLFFAFPFNFAFFAAVVPWPLQFIVSWITNGIAKIVWLLFLLGSAAFIPFFAFQLQAERRKTASTIITSFDSL